MTTRFDNHPASTTTSAVLTLLAMFLVFPVQAGGQRSFQTEASVTLSSECPVESESMSGPYQAAAELLCGLTDGGAFANMRASAESRHGLLRSEAIVDSEGKFATASATSSFKDTITVNAPVAPGTVGTLDIRMPFSGQLLANLSGTSNGVHLVEGSAHFDLQVRARMLNSGGDFSESRSALRLVEEGVAGDEIGVLLLPIQFVFGEPIQLDVWLAAGASAVNCGPDCRVTASSRYGRTAWMEGIQEVRLLDETPVADFEITSDSGTDYTQDQFDLLFRDSFLVD